ncbi:hypothetical protein Y1Q_0023776 [Alligator mississippiensis]|uniref:Uncharacterized protein n=1 Tax=Alligator mississippiensis TaxID=8496 RepID=A0A151MK58_ALLMI|nr:hypothetical protein Y1Q_0023776 [Alligator mississippiensis]
MGKIHLSFREIQDQVCHHSEESHNAYAPLKLFSIVNCGMSNPPRSIDVGFDCISFVLTICIDIRCSQKRHLPVCYPNRS